MNRIAALVILGAAAAAPAADPTPLSMQQCVEYARANSPALKKLEIALRNSELETIIRNARFAVGISGSAARDTTGKNTSGAIEVKKEIIGGFSLSAQTTLNDSETDESDSASWSVTLSKVILGGGSLQESFLEIDNSLMDEVIALNNLRKSCRELEYKVRQACYRTIRNTQSLKVKELKLQTAKRNLEHATERENPLDIATASIEVPENEAAVLSARQEIAASLDDLKQIMGMDIGAPLEIDPRFAFQEESVNPTNDIPYCLENHEDMLNSGLERRKLENEIGVLKDRVWPRVTLSGAAGQGSLGSLDFDGRPEYSVGLSFSWELGAATERATWRKRANDILARDLAIRLLRLEKENTIRTLARRLDEARQLVRLQQERVKFSARRVELYADRWENGDIDILEYVRSQNDLQDSMIQLINYKTTYMDLLGQYNFETARPTSATNSIPATP